MLSAVFGCSGTSVTADERAFFREVRPTGFILFARNVENPDQLKKLIDALRSCIDDPHAPVLIDQEGGRVQRLRPPYWRDAPPAARFADLYRANAEVGCQAARTNARLQAAELLALGITVSCAPVLDLRIEGAHDIIGDRAYGTTPASVGDLGSAVCDGLLDGGVLPVIKHIPGHGRASEDSHMALPRVAADLATLREQDFKPFAALNQAPWAMTAHIVYEALDSGNPATQSSTVVSLIRHELGFDGLLISDDLSMKALRGDYQLRAERSLAAGCDVVLHCNGDISEMQDVAAGCDELKSAAFTRLARGEALRQQRQTTFDVEAELARLESLLVSA
ncbi:beta-N-acetylhexosaminidase [Limibacillus sp. MBR-115]|jgi:beta-N-acetylhexosaminidase|uniref:beta-N-acetylhexosaminidase n=1 Tax=Limibacillus sp. MBR-115 TaxID=3156465 RepID=UPI003391E64B